MNRISHIARAVLNGEDIPQTDALYLLEIEPAQQEIYELFYWADRIRRARYGPEISLCSIASVATGSCPEDCRFCAQSSHYNTNIKAAHLEAEQLIAAANEARNTGAGCFGLVASGRSPTDEKINNLATVIESIAGSGQLQCCASLGCLSPEQARQLVKLGVRRYNHNLETSRRFFPHVVTTHTYEDRLATIRNAQQAGLEVCCGGIIGMGETIEDRVDLALTLRELEVDSVPINFLHPIPGTPLADIESLPALTALQTIAMFRFVLPEKNIKVAGGREQCLGDLQSWMFFAGASSTMIGNYLTTRGRIIDDDLQMFADLQLPLTKQLDQKAACKQGTFK